MNEPAIFAKKNAVGKAIPIITVTLVLFFEKRKATTASRIMSKYKYDAEKMIRPFIVRTSASYILLNK